MDDAVHSHLIRQDGVISRRQALASGVTSRQIDRLLRSRDWLRVRCGVYRAHAVAPSPESELRAVSLWLGPRALLTGEGAAWWWGVVPEAPTVWTFAAGHGRGGCGPAVRVVRAFVDPREQTEHRDVAVVSTAWAVLTTAAAWEDEQPGRGITLVDRAKQTRAVGQQDLETAFEHHPGCWGSPTIRSLLRRTGDEAHSELERLAAAALRRAGVEGFRLNHRTRLRSGRAVEIDIAFPDRRIAIELDGFAFHSGADEFRVDRQRGNELMADGWTVRRFTYDDVVGDPDGFVALVLELLAD